MDEDKQVTARFVSDAVAVTLTVKTEGPGQVSHSPGNPYLAGETATLEPSPVPGYEFTMWSGPDAGELAGQGDGTWTLSMNEDKEVTAHFAEGVYDVEVTIAGQGVVLKTPDPPYSYQDVVTLKPVPVADWQFAGWSGPDASALIANGNGSWSVIMTSGRKVRASFSAKQALLPLIYGQWR
jgi:hypothetical protein